MRVKLAWLSWLPCSRKWLTAGKKYGWQFHNYCDFHLSILVFCLHPRKVNSSPAEWQGCIGSWWRFNARAIQDGTPLGEPRTRLHWDFFPIFLMISYAQNTSHTFFRSCFLNSRKNKYSDFTTFMMRKRALEIKYMHAYKICTTTPQSCI